MSKIVYPQIDVPDDFESQQPGPDPESDCCDFHREIGDCAWDEELEYALHLLKKEQEKVNELKSEIRMLRMRLTRSKSK